MELIESVIRDFLARYPEYEDPTKAWGQCYQASFRLRGFLRRAGFKAHLLICQNCRLESFPRIVLATLCLSPWPSTWTHFVVCAEDQFVLDPTARQFDSKHAAVRRMSIADLQTEWLYYWEHPKMFNKMLIKRSAIGKKQNACSGRTVRRGAVAG